MGDKYYSQEQLDKYKDLDVDMHNHTYGSDGEQTILKLLKRAKAKKLKAVGVTDHDSVEGFHYFQHEICRLTENIEEKQEIEKAKKILDILNEIKIIKGVELICSYENAIVEVLAYNYDIEKMAEEIENLKSGLKTRAELFYNKFCNLIEEKNIIINREKFEQIYKYALEEEKNEKFKIFYHNKFKIKVINKKKIGVVGPFFKELIKNRENLQYLQYEENGIKKCANTVKEFITKHVYNKNSIFYVDVNKTRPSYENTIKAIHKAGGKAILAHPGRYNGKINIEEQIDNMIEKGLDGIEVWYPDHTKEFSDILLQKVKQYHLIASGGSDDHCVPSEGKKYELGNCKIEDIEETKWIYETINNKKDFSSSDMIIKECIKGLERILK